MNDKFDAIMNVYTDWVADLLRIESEYEKARVDAIQEVEDHWKATRPDGQTLEKEAQELNNKLLKLDEQKVEDRLASGDKSEERLKQLREE